MQEELFEFDANTMVLRIWTLVFILMCYQLTAMASEPSEAFCEYRTLELDPHTGEVRLISPTKIESDNCSESGAALFELDPTWRQRLPQRIRWTQVPDALQQCESIPSTWGQRTRVLPHQGCVFVQGRELCTIMTSKAISHAQLAQAVPSCAP
jgi:hypothetical protein